MKTWAKGFTPIILIMAAAASNSLPAAAQTPVGGPRQLGGNPAAAPQISVTTVPVPDSMVKQATEQAEGKFTTMKRGAVGGQVQQAWDDDKHKSTIKTALCQDCEYKVRLREYMVTLIELPAAEQIETFDAGDTENFEIKQRGPNRLAIRPFGYGIDTNLLVYGKSGTVYPLYIRAESINSVNIPDLRFVIEGHVRVAKPKPLSDSIEGDNGDELSDIPAPKTKSSAKSGQSGIKPITAANLAEVAKANGSPGKPADYVQTAAFNPDKLRGWGNYSLRGSNELKPESVFRDDYFTYIRFGEKWKDLELPTPYVVVDGLDEMVNSRVNGTTLVVESTQRQISLKSGKSFLCIEYRGT